MDNSKYLNYYVEILTGTMTDAVIRNVSLQANARVTDEVLKDQIKRNEDLTQQVNNLSDEVKKLKLTNEQSENQRITDLENKNKGHLDRIRELEKQLNDLNRIQSEYDNIKNQVSHLETFRNELISERNAHQKTRESFENKIKELSSKIEYLQLTPAQRKKFDAKTASSVPQVKQQPTVAPKAKIFKVEPPALVVKDGGSF